jgi:hypothetical protein
MAHICTECIAVVAVGCSQVCAGFLTDFASIRHSFPEQCNVLVDKLFPCWKSTDDDNHEDNDQDDDYDEEVGERSQLLGGQRRPVVRDQPPPK